LANLVLAGNRDIKFAPCVSSSLVAEIGDNCVGCEKCGDKCQFQAIRLNEEENRAEINLQRCMGCSVCEDQCPTNVITMRVEFSKGGIFDLDELKKAVR
jgi:ferredoxin